MRQLFVIALALVLGGCGAADDAATTSGSAASEAIEATAAEHAGDEPAPNAITDIAPATPVVDEELVYGQTSDRNLTGYFVVPADVIDAPGVIMIHEWWGLNDNIRAMARRLAGEGYAVLAIDLYGGETAETPAEAQALMAALAGRREAAIDNIRQAHAYLDEFAFAPRIATLGWCLGGAWSLEAGLALGDALDGVMMFYGQVVNDDARLAELRAPLYGIFAERDQSIPVGDVTEFRRRLRDLGKTADVVIYPGVDHAFANPSGNAYDHEAAIAAWGEALAFLDRRLR